MTAAALTIYRRPVGLTAAALTDAPYLRSGLTDGLPAAPLMDAMLTVLVYSNGIFGIIPMEFKLLSFFIEAPVRNAVGSPAVSL